MNIIKGIAGGSFYMYLPYKACPLRSEYSAWEHLLIYKSVHC